MLLHNFIIFNLIYHNTNYEIKLYQNQKIFKDKK